MHPFYFGNSENPLFGVYHRPRSQIDREEGVLLCYPIVQEYMRTHWAFRQLSNLLSKEGFHVLRFDYFGTGDSSGDSKEVNISQWMADIRGAFDELKDTSGVKKVSIVGLRLGAALAAEASAEGLDVKDLVLWDPVINGKSHIDELKAMHRDLYDYLPVARARLAGGNSDELLGLPFSSEMRAAIEQTNLLEHPHCPAEKIFLVVSEERSEYLQLRDQLTATGVQLDYHFIPDASDWRNLDRFFDRHLTNNIPQTIARVLARKLT